MQRWLFPLLVSIGLAFWHVLPDLGRQAVRHVPTPPIGQADEVFQSAGAGVRHSGSAGSEPTLLPEDTVLDIRAGWSGEGEPSASRLTIEQLLNVASHNYTSETPATNSVYAAIPVNDEQFANLYDKQPSASQWREIERGRLEIQRLRFAFSYESGVGEFFEFMKREQSGFVTIIGHNDRGYFKFPDGSLISLRSMAKACLLAAKKCIFLSCQSITWGTVDLGQIGVRSDLTFAEAALIAKEINERIMKGQVVTVEEIENQIPAMVQYLQDAVSLSTKIERIGVPVFAVGAATLLVVNVQWKNS